MFSVLPTASVRNLGFIFDFHLSFSDHISSVFWPVKIVPEMTYNVSSGTLNPTHSLSLTLLSLVLPHSWIVIFTAYTLFLTLIRLAPLAHLLFTPDLTTAILCISQTQLNRVYLIQNVLARAAVAAPRHFHELFLKWIEKAPLWWHRTGNVENVTASPELYNRSPPLHPQCIVWQNCLGVKCRFHCEKYASECVAFLSQRTRMASYYQIKSNQKWFNKSGDKPHWRTILM